MLISSEINSFRKSGTDKQIIKILKDAGFSAYDYSMLSFGEEKKEILDRDDYIEYAKELRAYSDEIGILCNQSHAPFPKWNLVERTEEFNQNYYKMIVS